MRALSSPDDSGCLIGFRISLNLEEEMDRLSGLIGCRNYAELFEKAFHLLSVVIRTYEKGGGRSFIPKGAIDLELLFQGMRVQRKPSNRADFLL